MNNSHSATARVLGRILAQDMGSETEAALHAAGAIGPTNPASTAKITKTAPYYFTDAIHDDAGHPVR
jgi:hypothetical protein